MNPKSIITVTSHSLPMVLKYQNREYIIRLTANNNLQMTKRIEDVQFEIDPNPVQVDLSPTGLAQTEKDGY